MSLTLLGHSVAAPYVHLHRTTGGQLMLSHYPENHLAAQHGVVLLTEQDSVRGVTLESVCADLLRLDREAPLRTAIAERLARATTSELEQVLERLQELAP